jgi:hypothetical protein
VDGAGSRDGLQRADLFDAGELLALCWWGVASIRVWKVELDWRDLQFGSTYPILSDGCTVGTDDELLGGGSEIGQATD